jgi:hypothetical protein
MKRLPLTLSLTMLCALLGPLAYAADEAMPEIEKIRFCKRVRDHAIQALYSRDGGSPMKLYNEDGSNGPRIINVIIRHIHAEPRIANPAQAEEYSQATCHDMMGIKDGD